MDTLFQLTKRHVLAMIMGIGVALMFFGALGPWMTASTPLGGISISGTYVGSHSNIGGGWLIMGLAIVGTVGIFGIMRSNNRFIGAAIAMGILGAAECVYVMVRTAKALTSGGPLVSLSWGWGLWASLLGSIVLSGVGLYVGRFEHVPTKLPTRIPRALLVLASVCVALSAAVIVEGVVIGHRNSSLFREHTALDNARTQIADFPTQLQSARQDGYAQGQSDTQGQYSDCYSSAYADGYLQGWDAVVSEEDATQAVQGGSGDPWWDPTTSNTC